MDVMTTTSLFPPQSDELKRALQEKTRLIESIPTPFDPCTTNFFYRGMKDDIVAKTTRVEKFFQDLTNSYPAVCLGYSLGCDYSVLYTPSFINSPSLFDITRDRYSESWILHHPLLFVIDDDKPSREYPQNPTNEWPYLVAKTTRGFHYYFDLANWVADWGQDEFSAVFEARPAPFLHRAARSCGLYSKSFLPLGDYGYQKISAFSGPGKWGIRVGGRNTQTTQDRLASHILFSSETTNVPLRLKNMLECIQAIHEMLATTWSERAIAVAWSMIEDYSNKWLSADLGISSKQLSDTITAIPDLIVRDWNDVDKK